MADSKEALLLEGVSMIGLGGLAFCFGESLFTMLMPLGILLSLEGLSTLIYSAWFFRRGSEWRRLSQQRGWTDLATGLLAFVLYTQNWHYALALICLWLAASGYFKLRRQAYLQQRWADCYWVGAAGGLSILCSLLLATNSCWGWLPIAHDLPLAVVALGAFKIVAFVKLGQIRRRLRQKVAVEQLENWPPLSPLNFN